MRHGPVAVTLAGVLAEGFRLLPALRLTTILMAGVTSASVFAAVVASGQGIADERRILAGIDDADTTTVTLIDIDGTAGLDRATVERALALSHVSWAVGLGRTVDAGNARLGAVPDTPVTRLVGDSPAITINTQREFGVLVSETSQVELNLAAPAGGVVLSDGTGYPVIGTFRAREPLAELQRVGLVRGEDADAALKRIVLSVDQPGAVPAVADALREVAGVSSQSAIAVEAPEALAAIREVVAGDLREQARRTVFGALSIGGALIALVTFASVSARRRDFGRRRALGARRHQLLLLVVTHASAVSLLGGAVGGVAASLVVRVMTSAPVTPTFPLAVIVLMTLVSALAACGPATVAALRDPVAVLRTP